MPEIEPDGSPGIENSGSQPSENRVPIAITIVVSLAIVAGWVGFLAYLGLRLLHWLLG